MTACYEKTCKKKKKKISLCSVCFYQQKSLKWAVSSESFMNKTTGAFNSYYVSDLWSASYQVECFSNVGQNPNMLEEVTFSCPLTLQTELTQIPFQCRSAHTCSKQLPGKSVLSCTIHKCPVTTATAHFYLFFYCTCTVITITLLTLV